MSDSPRLSPLSSQQQTYWEAERRGLVGYRLLGSDARVSNAFGAFRVEGPLDLEVLQRALNEVLQRHESLRTRFQTIDGQVMQSAADTREVPLAVVDVTERSSLGRERTVAAIAADVALGGFSHTSGLLLRAGVLRVSAHDAVVVLSVPHLIADSASIQILLHETLTLYAHGLRGRPSPLPAPDAQYAGYVDWQRAWVSGEASRGMRDDMVRRLTGARPLRLPIDEPASRDPADADAGELRFALDAARLTGVQSLSASLRVTPFVVMLSAFTMLLSRWSGETDVLLLAPFAARPDARSQRTIGLFSNLCPLRTDLSGNPRFLDVLDQTQDGVLRALHARCLPHAALAEALEGRGDISCSGVGVNAVPDGGKVLPRGCAELLGPGVRVSPYVIDANVLAVRRMRGDLSFWIGFSADGGITGRLVYRRASFREPTVARVAGSLVAALGALAERPDGRIADLVRIRTNDSVTTGVSRRGQPCTATREAHAR